MTLGVGPAVFRLRGAGGKLLPSSLLSDPTCLFIKQCVAVP